MTVEPIGVGGGGGGLGGGVRGAGGGVRGGGWRYLIYGSTTIHKYTT